jgi:hypothetical protein
MTGRFLLLESQSTKESSQGFVRRGDGVDGMVMVDSEPSLLAGLALVGAKPLAVAPCGVESPVTMLSALVDDEGEYDDVVETPARILALVDDKEEKVDVEFTKATEEIAGDGGWFSTLLTPSASSLSSHKSTMDFPEVAAEAVCDGG